MDVIPVAIVNTEILFRLLLKSLRPEIVCDIGSLDGREALLFKGILPFAKIIAFEANPRNYHLMMQDIRLRESRIEVTNKAVSDKDGTTCFHIEALGGEKGEEWRRGSSSTRKKVTGSLGVQSHEVEMIRLDTYLSADDSSQNIALWVDVEGAAYEVLAGMAGIKTRVQFVHVEVENQEIWKGQKLEGDVDELMRSMGFLRIAQGNFKIQHDVVYLNADTFGSLQNAYRAIIRRAQILGWIRKRGGRILGNLILKMSQV